MASPIDATGPVAAAWTPYCGAGPSPAELIARWNLDPVVIGLLALGAAGYAVHRRRGGAGRDLLVAGGLAALAVSFVSPLCALSSALFSARVAHHALLVAVAAPLLVFGLPKAARLPLGLTTLVHVSTVWLWHAPGPYAWALSHDAAYWLMQASLFGSALAFWSSVRTAPAIAAAGALVATMMLTGLLGALITFAGQPLYAPHLATTYAWSLTPLADQQLAGLIMWAPMALAYLIAALVLVGRSLADADTAAARA
ncbi:cytochrome c oxidase assembly protein [Phenylobacterium terrae]|uniref:Cytochrome c oxidase assembly protein n=1 Tax=Phenylobacterium terrae TaxID=2665495 RepID=A0ABW4N360_9CAUL